MDTSTRYGLAAIAASGGGITPLRALLSKLARNLNGPKLVELLDHHAGLTPTGATS